MTTAAAAWLAAPWVHASEARVMRFAWWGGAARHAATLKATALFEQRNPGLKVKAEYMGFAGYLERLTTQIAGGSEPDVMQINWAWMAMFSKRGNGFSNLDTQATPSSSMAAARKARIRVLSRVLNDSFGLV